jgi:hypothetical protein
MSFYAAISYRLLFVTYVHRNWEKFMRGEDKNSRIMHGSYVDRRETGIQIRRRETANLRKGKRAHY